MGEEHARKSKGGGAGEGKGGGLCAGWGFCLEGSKPIFKK